MMFHRLKGVTPVIAAATLAAASFATAQPASAARHMRARHVSVLTVRKVPATQRPGFVFAPGYPDGPPGSRLFSLIDFSANRLAPLFPTTPLFAGVPILGALPILGTF